MTKIIRLAPHDPIPTSPGRQVMVLHRFDEESPRETVTTITLTGERDESARPMQADGTPMDLERAVEAAVKVAESEHIAQVYVLDRTQGEREHAILEHGGDHSIDGERLVDFDLEEGLHGPDMRDRAV